MKLGDYVRAESNGGWLRVSGTFLKDTGTEIAIDVDGEVRYLKKNLFTFKVTDVNGREIK